MSIELDLSQLGLKYFVLRSKLESDSTVCLWPGLSEGGGGVGGLYISVTERPESALQNINSRVEYFLLRDAISHILSSSPCL